MRPVPARVLLSAIALTAFGAAAFLRSGILVVTGIGASLLLATSLMTTRFPLTRALQQFQSHVVDVRLWGTPPPGSASRLTITAINALGAGTHVFFSSDDGESGHLKIAQPKSAHFASGAVVIHSAKYVQWNGKKVAPVSGAPAVTIAAIDSSNREPLTAAGA